MKIQILDFQKTSLTPKKVVLTLGCFDGIHRGHQSLIRAVQDESQKRGVESCLCIFDPHPFQVLKSDLEFKRLFTILEIKEILKNSNLDHLCIIPFDLNFSKLSSKDFIYSFLKNHFDPLGIVVGHDFSFGFQKQGTVSYLEQEGKKTGMSVQQVPAVVFDSNIVSSSRIKKELSLGCIEKVNSLLGHPFFIQSTVIEGEGKGRELGFPTANLFIESEKHLPKKGVYSCWAIFKDGVKKRAVMNIGHRPTIKQGSQISVEVHIIGENCNLYGEPLRVDLEAFIREEIAFSGISELKQQIEKDIQKTLNNFEE